MRTTGHVPTVWVIEEMPLQSMAAIVYGLGAAFAEICHVEVETPSLMFWVKNF